MTKRIMREFNLKEISSVTRPAQKGARALIMKSADAIDDSAYEKLCKRTFTAEERRSAASSGAAMPGGRYPIENGSDLENAIHAVGRGKGSHAAIRAHIMSRARSLGMTDKLPDDWKASKRDVSRIRNGLREAGFDFEPLELSKFADRIAEDALTASPTEAVLFDVLEKLDNAEELDTCYAALCVSVDSIFGDADVLNKSDQLQATFQSFKDAVQGLVSGSLETTISAALSGGDNGGDMSKLKEIAKALGLKEDASEEDVLAATIKVAKTEKDELVAKLAKAEAINKLSAKHKAYMENDNAKMPKGGKDAFVAMSPSERDAHMSANPCSDNEPDADDMEKMIAKGDAFKSVSGKLYKKSVLGAEVYKAIKDQDDEMRKDRAEIVKARETEQAAKFTKAAADFDKLGKPEDLATLLGKTAKADQGLADAWMVVLQTANERIVKGDFFKEVGSGKRGFAKAFEAIDAKARELMKGGDKAFNTIEKARSEIRRREPDLVKQEQEEARQARAAA